MKAGEVIETAVIDRFSAKVDKSPDCWEWIGAITSAGYGSFWLSSRSRSISAHRLAWIIRHGSIPDGEGYHGVCVLHHCDNRKCVNPSHLFLGSNQDNVRDCVMKGRLTVKRGAEHGMSKLNEDDVRKIRLDTRPSVAIAKDYCVGKSTINYVKTRQTWSHVE